MSNATKSLNDLRAEAAEIREVLDAGADNVMVDGTATHLSLATLRGRLREIESQLPEVKDRRPRSSRVNLG